MPYGSQPPRFADHPIRWWAFIGGPGLAAVAGYVNAVFIGVMHLGVSHVSGTVSTLSIDLGTGNQVHFQMVLPVIGGFLLGAILSGIVIGGTTLLPGRRYGVALMLEATLLAVAAVLLTDEPAHAAVVASMACGLQNGMASSYAGLILRTTHVTGVLTDIGVLIGHWLRHRHVDGWKIAMLACLLAGFACGGLVGAVLWPLFGSRALALPAGCCFLAGALYYRWKLRHCQT